MEHEELSLVNEVALFTAWRDDAVRMGLSDAASELKDEVLSRKELIIRIKGRDKSMSEDVSPK
jgi:hypothetical protein